MKRIVLAFLVTAAAGTASMVWAAPRPAAMAAAPSYEVDSVHSSIVFCVRHMNVANFYGQFRTLEGQFTLDGDNSTFEFSIPVDSINTQNEKRDAHLKAKDFFNADEFKAISFKSSKVKASGDNYEATGEMTMLGKAVPMTVTIQKTGEAQGRGGRKLVGLESNFTVKRSDFGLGDSKGLSDEVKLVVAVEAGAKE